jgi:hypothetical protein
MRKKMAAILVLAVSICLLSVGVARAFKIEIHGDFNNRYEANNKANMFYDETLITGSKANYINCGRVDARDLIGKSGKDRMDDDSGLWGELKCRMWVEASDDEEKIKGVWAIEVGTLRYGDRRSSVGKGTGGGYSGDGVNTETRWLYVDFQNPFIKQKNRFRLGLQPVGLNKFVWNETAMGVKWYGDITDKLNYELAWFRPEDNSVATDEENDDSFFGKVGIKFMKGWKANLYSLFLRKGGDDTYFEPTKEKDGDFDDNRLYFGAEVKGKQGPFGLLFNAIYLTGGVDSDKEDFFNGEDDLDRGGYFIHGDLSYDLTKNLKLVLTGMYASGDDDPNDSNLDNFSSVDVDISGDYSVIYFEPLTDDNNLSDAPYFWDKGFQNYRLKLEYTTKFLSRKLKLALAGGYLGTAEDVEWTDWDGEKREDDYIGTEIDGYLSYELYKGLTFNIMTGYLFSGDVMDMYSDEDDADDLYRFTCNVRYKF